MGRTSKHSIQSNKGEKGSSEPQTTITQNNTQKTGNNTVQTSTNPCSPFILPPFPAPLSLSVLSLPESTRACVICWCACYLHQGECIHWQTNIVTTGVPTSRSSVIVKRWHQLGGGGGGRGEEREVSKGGGERKKRYLHKPLDYQVHSPSASSPLPPLPPSVPGDMNKSGTH